MTKVKNGRLATEVFVKNEIGNLKGDMDVKFEEVQTRFDEIDVKFKSIDGKLDKMMKHVVDMAGKFNKFDEEQTILAGKVIEHTDQIEKLQKAVFLTS